MLASEHGRPAVDLHESKARHAALHGPREIHRCPRRDAVRTQFGISRIGVLARERNRRKTIATLAQETPVILEPWVLDRRGEELEVSGAEHDAMVLRADAVDATRREREAEPAKVRSGRVEVAHHDDRVVN